MTAMEIFMGKRKLKKGQPPYLYIITKKITGNFLKI